MSKPLTSLSDHIAALPADLRDRVLERACILWDSGLDWEEADRRAWEMETSRAAPGLARAEERDEIVASSHRRKRG